MTLKERNKIIIVERNNQNLFCHECGTQLIQCFCPKCKKKRYVLSSSLFYASKIIVLCKYFDEFELCATENNLGLAENVVDILRYVGLFVPEEGRSSSTVVMSKPTVVYSIKLVKKNVIKSIREEEE